MKRLFSAVLSFVCVVMLGSFAFAGEMEFTSHVGKFTVDVPDGWKAKPIDAGCQIDSADGKNSMAIQFIKSNNMSPKEFAKKIADSIKMKVASENADDEGVFLDGSVDGAKMGILVVKDDELIMTAILGGDNREKMFEIYKTTKGKD